MNENKQIILDAQDILRAEKDFIDTFVEEWITDHPIFIATAVRTARAAAEAVWQDKQGAKDRFIRTFGKPYYEKANEI